MYGGLVCDRCGRSMLSKENLCPDCIDDITYETDEDWGMEDENHDDEE